MPGRVFCREAGTCEACSMLGACLLDAWRPASGWECSKTKGRRRKACRYNVHNHTHGIAPPPGCCGRLWAAMWLACMTPTLGTYSLSGPQPYCIQPSPAITVGRLCPSTYRRPPMQTAKMRPVELFGPSSRVASVSVSSARLARPSHTLPSGLQNHCIPQCSPMIIDP